MEIVVLIKQVPETTDVKINPETNTLVREGVKSIINPFDEYAIEEGLRLRERAGGTVTTITMGPPQAEQALRESIALGVNNAVLLTDRAFAGADTLATSYTLAMAIKKLPKVDLIICGKQAVDGDTAQVGPGVAEKLDIPHVSYVRKIDKADATGLTVERMMEDGSDIIDLPLPCLITVVKEINTPRLPSLKGKIAAKKAVVTKWTAADILADIKKLGMAGSPTQVKKVFSPPPRKGGENICGEPEEQAKLLVQKLKELQVI
ncbi:MAG: electron transfer flavoprotein subunit beta/FixA family protein [Elusimicrobiota bacterium]